jgi:hypothetical protein
VAGLIARELGCDRAQGLVAATQASGAWSSFAGHWPDPLHAGARQWLVVIWLLVRWVRLRDDRLLVALGVVGRPRGDDQAPGSAAVWRTSAHGRGGRAT